MPIVLFSTIINIPADYPYIQDGIDLAADGDTVLVHPQAGGYIENIDFSGKAITVASLFLTTQNPTYISQTWIEADDNTNVVVRFSTAEDSLSALIGLTINGGNRGIECVGASPCLKNLIIQNNMADDNGGGIYCSNSNAIMENLIINYNTSAGNGGGIFLDNSHPIMNNVTITNNISDNDGGGIYLEFSNPILTGVSIISNDADQGGGIYCENSSPEMSNLTISGNFAADSGGGIYAFSNCNFTLDEATISGNSSEYKGGGYLL